MVGISMDGPSRDQVMKLIEEKDRIEREIREQTAILESNNVSMHDSLVDSDGYPRSDIDVYKVRHARHQIICLQNDHKAIMKRIEEGLCKVHSEFRGSSNTGSQQATSASYTNGHAMNDINRPVTEDRCFAIVGFVHDGSPADLAGLSVNDKILQFGSINHSNFSDVTQVNQIVSHSVGQRIEVRVRRDQNVISLTVVPRPWAHPGLLGCQIRTYTVS
ncbi:PREDICTED: 26S proteasome non-ATPase regulatory subunit 9 [Papilio polytes]|uniref:26S proteasome non-ATPase regulatory subunit 9 n=1 Tax=Papilio polytes TaxID=76194 RepID=UPI0006767AE0|nr:PREDICTED: 26S proteasome non-ATPase regulatory subunit 9 [Papilio polytes]